MNASRKLLLIVVAAAVQVAIYRFKMLRRPVSQAEARRRFRLWSTATCDRLGIRVTVDGTIPATPCVFIANHRTYLDIAVLGSRIDAAFLSRADIADWRVIGTAARAIGCVFVERDDVSGRMRAARALLRLPSDSRLIIFPEGTTNGAPLPGEFPLGLFRLLLRLGLPIVPLTLRYSDRRAYWVDDIGISRHLRERVLGGGPLDCVLHVGRAINADDFGDAESLSNAVRAQICAPIEGGSELTHPSGGGGV